MSSEKSLRTYCGRDGLNKWAVSIGILAILIGIVLVPSSGVSQNVNQGSLIDDVQEKWSVQGYLKQNEILLVGFAPSHDWSLPVYWTEDIVPAIKYFKINITNPVSKNYTLITVGLVPPMGATVEPPYNFILTLYAIKVSHHGALIEQDNPPITSANEIDCGTVRDEGLYTVNCSIDPLIVLDKDPDTGQTYHRDASPPSEVRLSKAITHTEYPNLYFLPGGISAIAVGAVLSVWGARSKWQKVPRHVKRKNALIRKV
jgi:hypothetical protein